VARTGEMRQDKTFFWKMRKKDYVNLHVDGMIIWKGSNKGSKNVKIKT
jgi:hypothetical protein